MGLFYSHRVSDLFSTLEDAELDALVEDVLKRHPNAGVLKFSVSDIFSGALTRNRKLMNIHVCSAQRHRKSQTPNISEHRI